MVFKASILASKIVLRPAKKQLLYAKSLNGVSTAGFFLDSLRNID